MQQSTRSGWFTKSDQFTRGKLVEKLLDLYLNQWFDITKTTDYQERVACLGDRKFKLGDGCRYVEYKSGIQTSITGNLFLETVSVDAAEKPGWVITCQADWLIYALVFEYELLFFKPDRLRGFLPALKQRYQEKPTANKQNPNYKTWGLIVPYRNISPFCEFSWSIRNNVRTHPNGPNIFE